MVMQYWLYKGLQIIIIYIIHVLHFDRSNSLIYNLPSVQKLSSVPLHPKRHRVLSSTPNIRQIKMRDLFQIHGQQLKTSNTTMLIFCFETCHSKFLKQREQKIKIQMRFLRSYISILKKASNVRGQHKQMFSSIQVKKNRL